MVKDNLSKLFNKLQLKNKNILWLIISILIIFTTIYTLMSYQPYWDEGIYVNNGKYVFSSGNTATYEDQRPPLLGLISGLFWKLGLNTIIFSKLFVLFTFILGIYFLYKVSEDMCESSGVYSVLLYVSLPFVLFWTNRILTSFPSICFTLISLYFFNRNKHYLTGLFCAITFLFRYPSGIILFIYCFYILLNYILHDKSLKGLITVIKKGLFLGLGFITILIPFLLFNYFFLNLFEYSFIKSLYMPFVNARLIVGVTAYDLAHNGFLYYLKFLLTQNLFLVFIVLFIVSLFLKNKIVSYKSNIPLYYVLFYFLYVSTLGHYEQRYFMLALPFCAIISSFVLLKISNYFNKYKYTFLYISKIVLIVIFIISVISILISSSYLGLGNKEKEYYTYFENKEINGILIDDPIFGIYINDGTKIFYLAGPYYANSIYNLEYGNFEYIAFGENQFNCWDNDSVCIERLELFNKQLSENELVYSGYFYDTNHFIYKIK